MPETNFKPMNLKETAKEREARWVKYAEDRLKGRTIVGCRYLSKTECQGLDWYKRPIVMILDNGTFVFPTMDDEGNNGGALFGQSDDEEMTFPVL